MLLDVVSFSLWVKLSHPTLQPFPQHELFLLDGGLGAAAFTTRRVGNLWARLFVDGVEKPLSFGYLPAEEWGHVHVEATRGFSGPLHVMGSLAAGLTGAAVDSFAGNLRGTVVEVYAWGRALSPFERVQVRASPWALVRV